MISLGTITSWLIGSSAGRWTGAVMVGLIAFGAYTAFIRNDAANDALQKVEEINRDLENNAIDARDARRQCNAIGGMSWDFGSGKCVQLDASGGD